MTHSQLARCNARKEFNADRRYLARPWLEKPPRISVALIIITYAVIVDTGERMFLTTWSIGSTVRRAVRNWLDRRQEKPAADDWSYEVVTEPKKPAHETFVPLGPREEPTTDTIKEYLAAG